MMFIPLGMIFAAMLSFNDPLSFNRLSNVYLLLLGVENHKYMRLKFWLPLLPHFSFTN